MNGKPRRHRWTAAGAVLALVALGACSRDESGNGATATSAATTGPATTAATAEPTSSLVWESCEDGFECSTLEVPRDWADPDGDTIELALIRRPVPDAEGTVVVNWGGPGASGLTSIRTNGERIVETTGGRMEVVSWDPRGLGASTPILCPEGNEAYFFSDPSTPEGLAAMAEAVQERARACSERYGDYLGLLGTNQVARDLDAIRAALGLETLNFLGHSYGTRVGSVYAALFPERVGNMVLDGSLAPTSTLASTAWGDVAAFDAALNEWFAICAANPPCALGDDPAAGFDALLEQVRTDPPEVPGTGERLTPGLFNQIILLGIANYNGSMALADEVIADFRATGDPTNMYQLARAAAGQQPDGSWSNSPEIFQFVNCLDWYDRPTLHQVADAVARAEAASPRVGAFAIAFSYLNSTACPEPAVGSPIPTSTDLPPILVVGSTVDAETPLQWSQELSAQLANSRLLVAQSFGHTAYYTNACAGETAGAFLRTGEIPPQGTVCPPG